MLAAITRARPKIASYPFTTLDPNLGVSYYNDKEVTLADIPGLVEGAHKGVGLGDKFLRHVERCKMLLHLIDLSDENLLENYLKIRSELIKYGDILGNKKELIVFNKSDLLEKSEIDKKIRKIKGKIKNKFEIITIYSKKDLLNIKKLLLKNVAK